MKILVSTNKGPNCGVSQTGFLTGEALRRGGHTVTIWEHDYPRYLPEDAGSYDVVHINFHPGPAASHIQRQHLPNGPILSMLCHEYSPLWDNGGEAPSLWTSQDVLHFCSDPLSSGIYWPLPIPDYRPTPTSMIGKPIKIGFTGIRKDGLDWLEPICKAQNWKLDAGKEWLSLEAEIDRLSKCHLNVVHPRSGYSGSSSAVTTAIAARRPVLVNSNPLLRGIWDIDQGLGKELYRIEDFKSGVEAILEDLDKGCAKRPLRLADEYSWANRVGELVKVWENEV